MFMIYWIYDIYMVGDGGNIFMKHGVIMERWVSCEIARVFVVCYLLWGFVAAAGMITIVTLLFMYISPLFVSKLKLTYFMGCLNHCFHVEFMEYMLIY